MSVFKKNKVEERLPIPSPLKGNEFKGYSVDGGIKARTCAFCANHKTEVICGELKSDCANPTAKEAFSINGRFQIKKDNFQVGWFCPHFK